MAQGPSSSRDAYLVGSQPNITVTSLLTSGDSVGGRLFVGNPDGIGAFDNGATIVVTVNHEIAGTSPAVRAHGSAGAFVSRVEINKATLAVTSLTDLATSVFLDTDNNGTPLNNTAAGPGQAVMQFFCSADMPAPSALGFRTNVEFTTMGTNARIHFAGEEAGPRDAPTGRAFAFIATGAFAGQAYELPTFGNMRFENIVANPTEQAKTIVSLMDDSSTLGQVYIYVGTKQFNPPETLNPVEAAGLLNGLLYGVKVAGLVDETAATATNFTSTFTLSQVAGASLMTGAQLQTQSETQEITEFLRPEDGAWDPTNPSWYWFHTTASNSIATRLWRLEFNNILAPEQGGTIRSVIQGGVNNDPTRPLMLDNMTIDQFGRVYGQEDSTVAARSNKIWIHDRTLTGANQSSTVQILEHDPVVFANQSEESAGILDVTAFFNDPTSQYFLANTMTGVNATGDPNVVTGGQLQLIKVVAPTNGGAGADVINGSYAPDTLTGGAGDDTMRGGSNPDQLIGQAGVDTISGDDGDDILNGGADNDVLRGGAGNDIFVYGAPTDLVSLVTPPAAAALEIVDGGAGTDTIQILGVGETRFASRGTVTGVEVFQFATAAAGAAAMTVLADGLVANTRVEGNAFMNTFEVWANADFSAQAFTFVNWGANDLSVIVGGTAAQNITGSVVADVVTGASGNDNINGLFGDDLLFGGQFVNGAFAAFSGDDAISGGEGADRLWGMDGADTLVGENGDDFLTGGAGNDILSGGAGADFLFGGDFVGGTFGTGSGDDTLNGGDGRDALYGFDGNDFIATGIGDDYVEGGDGSDNIVGGAGNSFLLAGAGGDGLTGGGGFDYLYGQGGADLFNFRLGDSYDWVLDFSAAEGDRLRLDPAFGITSFAGFLAAIATSATLTQLTVNGGLDQITLFGVGTGQWTAAMVEFV